MGNRLGGLLCATGALGAGSRRESRYSRLETGVSAADFRLGWREDWGEFPTNDLDLILVRPNRTVILTGATLNNPEVVSVQNPAAGQWLVIVDGFTVATGQDKFELRIALDGNVVEK